MSIDIQSIVNEIVEDSEYQSSEELATAERSTPTEYETEDAWLADNDPDDVVAHIEQDMSTLDTWRLDWLLDNAGEITDGRKRILSHLVVPEIRDSRHPNPKYNLEFYCRLFIESSGGTWSTEYQKTVEKSLQSMHESKTLTWFSSRYSGVLPQEF